MIRTLRQTLDNVEWLKSGADELIDGDTPFSTKHNSVDERSDIGVFAEEIGDSLDCCSDMIDQVREQLAKINNNRRWHRLH